MSLFYKIKAYIRYRFKAKNEFALHSPFLFDLYNNVFKEAKKRTTQYNAIEDYRSRLLKNHDLIHFTDLGAGAKDNPVQERSVSEIARSTSKPVKYTQFLALLAHYLKSEHILELGTSVGITALYLAKKNPTVQVTTIEGCKDVRAIARLSFAELRLNNIESLEGNFDLLLPVLVSTHNKPYDFVYIDGNHTKEATLKYFHLISQTATNKTVIVFDDIYWSPRMTEAWNEIVKDPKVTVSIDMFEFGIVFFQKELSKQHFVLKY